MHDLSWPSNSYKTLIGILFFKAIAMAFLVYSGVIGLGPDEAQYWTWSQQLDFGYYSKPPGIAWQIALGAALFGNNELGVRFASLIIGFFLPLATYQLARNCSLNEKTSFWAALIMAFSPLGFLASMLAITDGGMVLFWAAATAVICRALDKDQPLPFYLIGLLILCGALFKWPIYLLWLVVVVFLAWKGKKLSWQLAGGVALSLLGLLPSLIWNLKNDFATFRHVFFTVYGKETIDVGTTTLQKGNFFEFFGAQSLLLSPILFACLLLAFVQFIKRWKNLNSPLQFCGFSSLSILIIYGGYSFFKKLQGNWADFAYPAASVLVAWYACQISKRAFYWLVGGVVTSTCLVVALFVIQQPFKHNLGWIALREALVKVNYDPGEQFLFADKYQTSSLLSFYAPGQKRAYFFNLHNIRKNQFSYWPDMRSEQMGKDGLFVLVEPTPPSQEKVQQMVHAYQEALKPFFASVDFLGQQTLVSKGGRPIKSAFIFSCKVYNGGLPENFGKVSY